MEKNDMKCTTILKFFLILVPCFCLNIQAQISDTIQLLPPEKIIEREMTGVQTHRYKFDLKANDFFQVRVEQKGIDIMLKLFDKNGKELATMDSPNGKEGSEILSYVTEKTSNFVLEITGFDATEKGIYIIKRESSKKADENDKLRVNTERIFVEGMKARDTKSQDEIAIKKLEQALTGWRQAEDNYLIQLTLQQINALKAIKAKKLFDEAFILFRQSTSESYNSAIPKFQEANKLYEEIGDKSESAGLSILALGLILDKSGKKVDAVKYYEKGMIFFQTNNYKTLEASTLNSIGRIYAELGEKQKALDYYNRSLSISKQLADKATEAITLNVIGRLYAGLGERQKALDCYNQSLQISRQLGDKPSEAAAINNIGAIYDNLGEKQKSLNYYNQSLIISREIKDEASESTILNNIGRIYEYLGEKQRALDYYNQSLLISKQLGIKSIEAILLNNIGRLYNNLGEKQKASDHYNQSLIISREIGDKTTEVTTLNNIGGIYNDLGERKKALEYYDQSLIISREIKDREREATALNNIGRIYIDLGDKQKALDYYNQSLIISRQIGDKEGEAITLTNIGRIYDILSEKQKALDYYSQSLLISRQTGDKGGEAVTLNNVGAAYDTLGERQKALDYYKQSLQIKRQIGDKKGEATTLNNIGSVYYRLGERQKALDYYNQSLPILRQIADKDGEAILLGNLMNLYNDLQIYSTAILYGKQSVNAYQQIRSNIKGLDKSLQETYTKQVEPTYRLLSDILIKEGRLAEAQSVLDLLKEDEFAEILRRSGNSPDALPYSKAEADTLKTLEQIAALAREQNQLKDKLEKGILTDAEKNRYKEIAKQIEISEAEFQKSLAQLSAEKNKGDTYDAVTKEAQAFMSTLGELGKGTVAIYTVIVNDDLSPDSKNKDTKAKVKTAWAILVTPEFRKAYPIDVNDLETTIFNFRKTLTSPVYDTKPFAQELYKKIFLQTSDKQKTTLAADLEDYLKDKPNKNLMWSLDGILRYIPIAALHDGKQYLVEKYQNTVFNTASKDRLKDNVSANWTALGLGVSIAREESGKKFSALPGTESELLKIIGENNTQGLFKGTIKLNEEFTAEAMEDALTFNKNSLIHIASHFSYNSANFDDSFLLLGKGRMTVKDFSSKSNLFAKADLLTLSACETAVADANGKDAEGFAYLAQSLGAKAVLATLWQIDDVGTQVFMPEFYRLHETGLKKGEALRQAQISLLNGNIKGTPQTGNRAELVPTKEDNKGFELYKQDQQKPFAHPYYWSPFILIGNWK